MRILSYKRGITLVETVVAVTILAAAIAGPMTLASQSLKASRDAKNELIATHLAEEGIEVIHSLRDNASAIDSTPTRTSWMVNLFAACISACGIDSSGHMPPVWANDAIVPCVNPDCSDHMIFYNSTTGLYKQSIAALVSPWSETRFTRVVKITGIDNGSNPMRQARIFVQVSYPGIGNTTKKVELTSDVYNWFPQLN